MRVHGAAAQRGARTLAVLAMLAMSLIWASACSAPRAEPADQELSVFAASSLSEALPELAALFQQRTGIRTRLSFGASSQLRIQIDEGAPADLFASADQMQMDRALQAGAVTPPAQVIATNQLVVAYPASNPVGLDSFKDIAKPGVRIIAAQSDVPIGVYTESMLDALGRDPAFGASFRQQVRDNVVTRETNVRQMVAKLQFGEGDAAIVYRTDVTPSVARDVAMLEVPAPFNVIAHYPIAVVTGSPREALGKRFIELVLSDDGQGVLRRWGFLPGEPGF